MKHTLLITAFCLCIATVFGQKESLDLFTFNIPAGWKKEITDGVISYSTTNKAKGS